MGNGATEEWLGDLDGSTVHEGRQGGGRGWRGAVGEGIHDCSLIYSEVEEVGAGATRSGGDKGRGGDRGRMCRHGRVGKFVVVWSGSRRWGRRSRLARQGDGGGELFVKCNERLRVAAAESRTIFALVLLKN